MSLRERFFGKKSEEKISYNFYIERFPNQSITDVIKEASLNKRVLATQEHLRWLLKNPKKVRKLLKKASFIFFIGDTNEDGTITFLYNSKEGIKIETRPVSFELSSFDRVLFVD